MIEIIKELNIEVSKPNIFQAVVAKQYDMNTRFIKATFVDDGNVIYIPNGDTVKVVINAERPDGQSKGFDGSVNDDGTVTVPLHSWMLELEGTVICDISAIDTEADDNKKLTTTTFNLLVERAAFGGSDITSDPQFDVLVALLDAATVAQEALDKSNEANAKYDACVEATQRANQAADGVVTIEQNKQTPLKFWVGTQEEYDAIVAKTQNCFYIISDDDNITPIENGGTGASTAKEARTNLGIAASIFQFNSYELAKNLLWNEITLDNGLRCVVGKEHVVVEFPETANVGSLYTDIVSIDIKSLGLTEIHHVSLTAEYNPGPMWAQLQSIDSNTMNVRCINPIGGNQRQPVIHYMIIGK